MLLKNLGFKSRMILLVVVFLLGILSTHLMYGLMTEKVRVNGPLYARIIEDKDLIADILPPPEYIIESYLVVMQLIDEPDLDARSRLIARYRELEKAYEDRHRHWDTVLPDGELKQTLVETSYARAKEFYRLVNEQVIDQVDHAQATDEVIAAVHGPIHAQYELHRTAIDSAVKLANQRIAADEKVADDTIRSWFFTQIVFGICVLLALIAISVVIGRGILVTTANLIDRMQDMAEGAADLTKRVKVDSGDEIGRLAELINAVIQRIHDLIARVQVSTIQLNSTATQIAAAAGEQNSTAQGFNASTNQIAASVKEITATGSELMDTVQDVHERAEDASSLASSGQASLTEMEATMQQLSAATGLISSKLGMIREKAGAINTVVETITKVADQTNLLSINAAIEAEKAGETGRGFLVVAREIRRLADQTAVATLDIEQMVRQMQDAVSAGVMEMDKFSEQVRACIDQTSHISGQMNDIIGQVQTLSERFHIVREGMQQQSQGAEDIDQAMLQLIHGVKQVGATASDFDSAAENLRRSAAGLQTEVREFKVSG